MNSYLERYPFTRIFFGSGKRKELGGICQELGKKCLLVTSRAFARRIGFLDQAKATLEKAGIRAEVFAGIEPEPSGDTVIKLSENIKQAAPDFLVALGGGSVMDACKCAESIATLGMSLKEMYRADSVTGALNHSGRRLRPMVALPSTAGSGSEVTKYAVVYDASEKSKVLIIDLALCPTIAVIDPELNLTGPLELTIPSGLDALSHILESYLNPQAAPDWLEPMSLEGIGLILENLPRLKLNLSDLGAREKMSLASAYGGIGITYKGTGLPHGFSYCFKDLLPHGSAVALTMVPSWRFYLPAVEAKTRKLAPGFGVEPNLPLPELGEAVFDRFHQFLRALGHPMSLQEVSAVDDRVLQDMVQSVLRTPAKLTNAPRPIAFDQAEQILLQILRS